MVHWQDLASFPGSYAWTKKSHFFVLQVTESWGEPGNKAKQDHSLVKHLSRVCLRSCWEGNSQGWIQEMMKRCYSCLLRSTRACISLICSHFAYISVRLLSFCLQTCIISPTYGYDLERLSRDKTDFDLLWLTTQGWQLKPLYMEFTTTATRAPALLNGFKYLVNKNASGKDSTISLTDPSKKFLLRFHQIL